MDRIRHIACAAIALLSLGMAGIVKAQPAQPIEWEVGISPEGNGTYTVSAKGSFTQAGWHIYDLKQQPGGPNSTVFSVSGNGVRAIGEPQVRSRIDKAFDRVFNMTIGTLSGDILLEQKIKAEEGSQVNVSLEWQACNDATHECLSPAEYETTVTAGGQGTAVQQEVSAPAKETPANAVTKSKSLWSNILAAILWGFVALLTPCVFPMVPMTVSFFLKQKSGKKLALIFGLSIVLLYTLPIAVLILVTLLTGGQSVTADIFNWLATHWLPNIIFFIVFMIFAASFFGAFEITLPSSLVNKSDRKSDKGGLIGTFFVALTLVLVSFSCTGPIVGSVLIESTRGAFWEPIITMLAFSIAFALPFTVLAFAPSLLKKMPKSGGWLGSVKVVLGFVELALGLKFLSVADQTYHWGILPRELYLALWIVIFSLLGLYLLGKLRFKHDAPLQHISVTRLFLAIGVFTFVVWMIPGMFGAPLKALSGYLPPITSQEFVIGSGSSSSHQITTETGGEAHKYSDFLKVPYGIDAYFDYDEALEAARRTGKPLFVDFTGHGCVNCREMESRVWSDPRVLDLLKNSYIVCSLFTDDKKVLPEEDWVKTESGKTLKSLGKINSNFALTRFGVNAQPCYIILDPVTEEEKVPHRGYDLNVESYLDFLRAGLR